MSSHVISVNVCINVLVLARRFNKLWEKIEIIWGFANRFWHDIKIQRGYLKKTKLSTGTS